MAEAVRQISPDVVMAHPVMPAATMLEMLASFVIENRLDCEFVQAESASSCFSACIGACAAGGRVFTATSSHDLAAMHETMMLASSLRLPIVTGIVNRALAAPQNNYADHSDSMAQRDNGWIQLYCETPQEAYDNLIQAYKIAEHSQIGTPVMVAMDGFITSHSIETVTTEKSEELLEFLGKFEPAYSLLDIENPVTIGAGSQYHFEQRVNQVLAMEAASPIIKETGKEFGDRFGRYYSLFESYKLEDAQYAIVVMSSAASMGKAAVDRLRADGQHVGLLKIRVFRPFPYRELQESLAHLEAVAVLDRSMSPGSFGGPLFAEIRASLYDLKKKPNLFPYIFGLGGREIEIIHIEDVFKEIKENSRIDEISEERSDKPGVRVDGPAGSPQPGNFYENVRFVNLRN